MPTIWGCRWKGPPNAEGYCDDDNEDNPHLHHQYYAISRESTWCCYWLPVEGTGQLHQWMTTPHTSLGFSWTLLWAWWWNEQKLKLVSMNWLDWSAQTLSRSHRRIKMKVIVCRLLVLFIFPGISSLDKKYILAQSKHVKQKMHMDGDVVKITSLIRFYC